MDIALWFNTSSEWIEAKYWLRLIILNKQNTRHELTIIPQTTVMPRPQYVFGTISPYPTHKNVIAVNQSAFNILWNSLSKWLNHCTNSTKHFFRKNRMWHQPMKYITILRISIQFQKMEKCFRMISAWNAFNKNRKYAIQSFGDIYDFKYMNAVEHPQFHWNVLFLCVPKWYKNTTTNIFFGFYAEW